MVPEIWSGIERIFCHFGPFFDLLSPLTTPKIKILKQWKKTLEISSFYSSAPKIMIICYTVPEIWPVTELIFIFHFKTIACPFKPPNDSKKIRIKKMKKCLEIPSFYTGVSKVMITWGTVPEIWCMKDGQTNRWTDGQKSYI